MGTSNSSQRIFWLFLIFNLNYIVVIFGATINSGEIEGNSLNFESDIKPLLEETTPVTQSDDANNDDARAAEATTLSAVAEPKSDGNGVNLKSDSSPEADPRLSMPCLTNDGQDGICTTFEDCFPILFGFEKLSKRPYSTQLQKDVLATTTRCLPKEGKVKVKTGRAGVEDSDGQNKNEVICCTSYIRLSRPPSDDYENDNGSSERDSEAVVIGSEDDIAVISAVPPVPASAEIDPILSNGTGIDEAGLDSIGWGGSLISGNRPPVRNLTEEPLIQSSCVNTKVVNLVVPPHEAIAPKGAYPWMAALMNNRGTQFCGGSLIDNYHILTAAHCIAHFKKPADVAKMRVYLGAHNLHATESQRMSFKVARILKHAKYSDRTYANDIALLKLAQPVKLTPSVTEPLCLNRKPGYDDGKTNATLAGWGRTSVVGGPSSILRHGTMRMWTNTECQTRYSQYIGPEQIPKIQPTMICAGSPGVDACQGDSGGPLFMKQENSPYEQYGIVSWGIGCGLYPGVYTRVDEYIPWIDKNRGLTKATAGR